MTHFSFSTVRSRVSGALYLVPMCTEPGYALPRGFGFGLGSNSGPAIRLVLLIHFSCRA